MNCLFCDERITNNHLCYKSYCYEYIFEQFFINILLDCKPRNPEEFFDYCQRRINNINLFKYIPNPYNILKYCLKIFLDEYECF